MLSHVIRGLVKLGISSCTLIAAASVFAGPGPEQGTPWVGQKGVTETVAQIMARAKLDPVYEPGSPPLEAKFEHEVDRDHVRQNPLSPAVSQWPPKVNSAFSILGKGGGPYLPQTVGTSFLATDLSENPGYIPPDTMGDVGPTHVLVMVNGKIRSWTKAGVAGTINTTTDNFFNSVRNASGTSDPRVKYDPLTGRWYLVIINVANSNNRVLLAVSSGSNPDTSTWTFFFFNLESGAGGTADNSGFFDYPTLGVDNNALYIGGNVFKGGFTGSTGFVVRKSSVTGGGPIVVTAFRQLCNNSVNGPYTPQGVDNRDPAATEGYFIGVGSLSYGDLWIRRISTPGGTPTISGNIQLIVPTTGAPQDFVIGGGGAPDTLDDRLFAAKLCKNRLTGVTTLWTAHNFEVNASGVFNSTGNRNGSRWYQIGNLSTTPTLIQSGTLFDSAATNPKHYWIPSVVMSGQGHMAIGTSWGSAVATEDPGVAVAGRLSSDALGVTQAPTFAVSSSNTYNLGNPVRWGDYSHTVVDPTDDMTIWTFQEYSSAPNVWGIRVVQLKAPGPVTPSSATPAVVQGQNNVNVTVTGASVSGTGFFYAGAGFNNISATVSGTGVTVNSVTFNSPTSVTLNVNVSGSATVGTRDVTITNPDGQSATGVGILTVNSGSSPPTITTISPNNATAAGPAFTLTVNGTNFTATSVVRWNGSNRTTTFVNANQVTAAIPASDIATVGTATVTVQDTAGTSNGVTFTINPIELAANAITRLLGDAVSGTLSNTVTSDDTYLVGRFRFDTGFGNPNLQWLVSTNSPSSTMSRLDIAVELKASNNTLQRVIQIKNNSTGLWDTIDTFTTAFTDVTRTVSITSGASNYIGAAGLVQLRLNFKTAVPTTGTQPVVNRPTVSLDYVHYTIWP